MSELKDPVQLAIKVLAAALSDRTSLERLCREHPVDGFPKAIQDFAKVVWEIPYGRRAQLTPDVLNDYLASDSFKATIPVKKHVELENIKLAVQKSFIDCQSSNATGKEFDYFFPKLKTQYSERLLREAITGKDEEGKLIEKGGKAVQSVAELISQHSPDAAAAVLKGVLSKIDAANQSDPIIRVEMHERAPSKYDEYELRKVDKSKAFGLMTGFGPLDDVTRGISPGELALIGGRPGTGKSQCLVNIAKNFFKAQRKGLLFSLEMPHQQYEDRFISSYAEIHNERMLIGALSEEEELRFKRAWEEVKDSEARLRIIDFPKINSFQIEAELIRAIEKYQPEYAIVDYLGIMEPNNKAATADWETQGAISDEVRKVARAYKIPIVSAVQLNRSKNKEASTDRLSRSDMIAQNADIIVMINDDEDKNTQSLSDMMKLTVIKNRKGTDGFEFSMYKNFSTITLKNPSSFVSKLGLMAA